ncbi:MAG TPA: hypothetical protein VIX12_01465 [Candidatus Binataceae bacterium]
MTRLTIVTKLRFAAMLAPIVLLAAAPMIAAGIYFLGNVPAASYENQYAAIRAAQGMEEALYRMDWGRTQEDGEQIVKDQQRRFVDWIGTARGHADSVETAARIEKIAQTANPLFGELRKAEPGDDSAEPHLRDLQGLINDLINADDGALINVSNRSAAQARILIAVTLIAALLLPWVGFFLVMRMSSGLQEQLRQVRKRVERIAERVPAAADDVSAMDASLSALGFPKPDPMLAE